MIVLYEDVLFCQWQTAPNVLSDQNLSFEIIERAGLPCRAHAARLRLQQFLHRLVGRQVAPCQAFQHLGIRLS